MLPSETMILLVPLDDTTNFLRCFVANAQAATPNRSVTVRNGAWSNAQTLNDDISPTQDDVDIKAAPVVTVEATRAAMAVGTIVHAANTPLSPPSRVAPHLLPPRLQPSDARSQVGDERIEDKSHESKFEVLRREYDAFNEYTHQILLEWTSRPADGVVDAGNMQSTPQ